MLANGECLDVNYLSVVIIFFIEGVYAFSGSRFFVCFVVLKLKFLRDRYYVQ